MKRTGNLVIIGILIFSLLPIGLINFTGQSAVSELVAQDWVDRILPAYDVFGQISIDNNSHFADLATTHGWSGDGSELTPYRIENLNITDAGHCIRIENVTVHFVISGCFLSCTGGSTFATGFDLAGNGTVEDSLISGGQQGIQVESSPGFMIDNCTITDAITEGIYVSACDYVNIVGSEISNSGAQGIRLFNSHSSVIQNCMVHNNAQQGIDLELSGYAEIHNNMVYDNENDAIHLVTSGDCNLTGNELFRNLNPVSDGGIYASSSHGCSVSGNTIYDNRHSGIYISVSNGWEVFDNVIYNNSDWGVYASVSVNTDIYSNNVSLNSWANGANGAGIYGAGCDDLNITECRIFKNHFQGVRLTDTYDLLLIDNSIDENGNDGVYSLDSARGQYSGNHVFNSTTYGIYVQSGDNCTFDGNNVTYSGDVSNGYNSNGITAFDCQRTTIVDNDVSESYGAGISVEMTTYYHNVSFNRAHDNILGISSANGVQNSTFVGNYLYDNNVGLGMTYTEFCDVTHNVIWDNSNGILLYWFVYDTTFYYNDIGWSSASQVTENDANCADNVWDHNWWSDYSGSGNYTVSSISEDRFPSKSLDLVAADPSVFEIGFTGNTMEFDVSALNPREFSVYINSSLYDSGVWDGGIITINLDSLTVGYHVIQLIIYHVSLHSLDVYTHANVTDLTAPVWSTTPIDQEITEGDSFSYQVSASDISGVEGYAVDDTVNFAIDSSGLITNVTTLTVGEYVLTVRVWDIYGNEIQQVITITVLAYTPPTTPTTPFDPMLLVIIGGGAVLVLIAVVIVMRKRGS